ncbi:hypothetical protein [Alkalihalobacterium chitinilyticum]|uniref:Uncharacterized protein n=1 Tax=Alkalihalobacterium chitinilyticum TaxID=2980103 RepID=A0ABT5VJ43_9BACI|nr:hypothetical protein [Alkalihalobacterium chitinilyticum]MDE5415478.1 hypothetical protein [Alkalihalobacterium chitinilyticum]
MAYERVRPEWKKDDPVLAEHMEQIESQYEEVKKDLEEVTTSPKINVNVRVTPSTNPTNQTGAFSQALNTVLSWITNRIRAITGETNWTIDPATNLKAVKEHMDADNPHAGSEPADPNLVKTTREATFQVPIQAASNNQYERAQIRNIVISDRAPAPDEGEDGDIWLIYMK